MGLNWAKATQAGLLTLGKGLTDQHELNLKEIEGQAALARQMTLENLRSSNTRAETKDKLNLENSLLEGRMEKQQELDLEAFEAKQPSAFVTAAGKEISQNIYDKMPQNERDKLIPKADYVRNEARKTAVALENTKAIVKETKILNDGQAIYRAKVAKDPKFKDIMSEGEFLVDWKWRKLSAEGAQLATPEQRLEIWKESIKSWDALKETDPDTYKVLLGNAGNDEQAAKDAFISKMIDSGIGKVSAGTSAGATAEDIGRKSPKGKIAQKEKWEDSVRKSVDKIGWLKTAQAIADQQNISINEAKDTLRDIVPEPEREVKPKESRRSILSSGGPGPGPGELVKALEQVPSLLRGAKERLPGYLEEKFGIPKP